MKKIFFLSSCFFIINTGFCQVSIEGLRNEFGTASKYSSSGRGNGYEGLQSFSSRDVKGSQFYFPGWLGGSLITLTNSTDASDYLFLYDKVRQELFMKEKTSDNVLEVSKDKIHGFTLQNNGLHTFTVASEYQSEDSKDFYEVLVKNDSGYALLKKVTTKFVKFDPNDMVKMKSGETSDAFEDETNYYLSYKRRTLQAVKIKDASIKKVLNGSYKEKAGNYITQNFDAQRNEDFLINLLRSIN